MSGRWLVASAIVLTAALSSSTAPPTSAAQGYLTHEFRPPLRGWAFPWNTGGSGSVINTTKEPWAAGLPPPSVLYPANTVNFVPTSQILWNDAKYNSTAGMTLGWAYCWDSPWVSKANGSVSNATSVSEYFQHQASRSFAAGERPGVGLDECNAGNENVKGERVAAAAGFRAARKQNPELFLAAWGANNGDELFASLMMDGTFSLAMVEAYSYCPGCGDWPNNDCCSTGGTLEAVASYYPRLDYARAQGYLNRTVFCFGYLLGKSHVNPRGWTKEMLRQVVSETKAKYPEMAGVLMYGHGPRSGFANATNSSTATSDKATTDLIQAANEIMAELYPDPDDDT
jgi:hypothetical protein